MYDLIIKNATIIDGTGAPGFRSDIAITKGKISCISKKLSDYSAKTIDAKGLVVTPGFIDSHSHSDNAVFDYPDMIEKIEQGITTSVGGQCGITLAPYGKEFEGCKDKEMYKTFGSMAYAAKDVELGSNLISFVGHGALRKAVIGYENRKPTDAEMEKMKELLREAMENGAVGVSFGLIYTPSCYGEKEELIELAKVVKEYEGLISAHIRNEGFELAKSVKEFLDVIKAVDVKAVFSHHKSMYEENWGKVHHTLSMIKEAVKEGYDIYCDVYPYIASQTGLVPTIIPKDMRDMDNDGIINMLKNEKNRDKIKGIYCEKFGDSLQNLQISSCKAHPEYEGMRISEIAKQWGKGDCETAFDIICDDGADTRICNFCICEDDVETVIRYERSMICTDASVAKNNKKYHPRVRASFPRAIGRYAIGRKVVSLQEIIRKCTSMPASVYGLPNKGLIKEGFDADLCIFDANTFIDKADFVDCEKRCEGLNYVILSGEVVVENAVYNGIKKGEFILRQR